MKLYKRHSFLCDYSLYCCCLQDRLHLPKLLILKQNIDSDGQVSQEEKEQLNNELQELVKDKARLELNIKDMKREVEDDSNARVRNGGEAAAYFISTQQS